MGWILRNFPILGLVIKFILAIPAWIFLGCCFLVVALPYVLTLIPEFLLSLSRKGEGGRRGTECGSR